MKLISLSAALLTSLLLSSCSSKTDSTKAADTANEQKTDNAGAAGAQPAPATTAGKSHDVATYLVDLANTGRTEFELSQAAAARAASPAVKAYAHKTVGQHAKDEQELKAEAAKYHVTLPTTLSDDSQKLMAEMGKEKAGAAFDKKYLTDMADVNDKAIGKAKDLVASTDQPELKGFVEKVMRDDEEHLAEAKRLKDGLK